ncbi:hypothetical protein PR202_ga27412 [Eleusine coracana subsp. coracana]|uniref:DeSI-like protein n=1 Tax=Eleusine coracana subsp. coracana TaxID=191504 RepID=A0AAV5DGF6_ELECO|nr:hypothetical protein PR202_ga27412 [Eleusine coracana subsp. coracana]
MMRVLPASWSSCPTVPASSAKGSSSTAAAVYLNIYDISPLNHYLYWFGFGIFHSGIEGSYFNCILPESIKVAAVRDATTHHDFSDDDGLGSNASIIDGSDEDDLDHLLTTPNSDVIPSRDRTLTPARDSF